VSVVTSFVIVAVRAQPMRLKARSCRQRPGQLHAGGRRDETPDAATRARQPAVANPAGRPTSQPDHLRGTKLSQLRKGATVSSRGNAGPAGAPSPPRVDTVATQSSLLAYEGWYVEAYAGSHQLAEVAEVVQIRIGAEPIAPFTLQQTALETTGLSRRVVHRNPLNDHDHLIDPAANALAGSQLSGKEAPANPVSSSQSGNVAHCPLDVITWIG